MTQDERINNYLLNLEQDGTIINPIISAYRGSIAHNMYVPNTDPNSVDDIDLISICIPTIDYYFGLKEFGSRGTVEIKDDDLDIVVYELKKTIKMLINGNPNIMSLLWLREEHYLKLDVIGEWLIKSRNLFSTKKVYDSFIGYANSQFSKMEKYSTQGYMGEKRKRIVEQFGYDCYDAKTTEFLTDNGWKFFDDVCLDDKLATIDADGGAEFQTPTERIDRLYSGMLYTIEPRSSRAVVTENHNLLVSPAHRSKSNKFSIIYEPEKANWRLESVQDLLAGRRSHFHIRRAPEPRTTEKKELVDDLYLTLAGLYLSEGSTNFKDGKVRSIRYVQSKPGPFWILAEKVMEAFPFKKYTYERESKGGYKETQWILNGQLAKLVNKDFGHCKSKHLPNWCFHLSYRQANILWESLMAGDGYSNKNNDCYYTSIKKLADDIQACMVLSGHPCVIYGPFTFKSNLQEGKMVTMYHVVRSKISDSFHDLNLGKTLHNGQTAKYKEGFPVKENAVTNNRVVCFTVPNSTLITRNNGAVAIHGNCKNASHLIRLLKMCVEFMYTSILNVYREDDQQELLDIKLGEWSLEQVRNYAANLFRSAEESYSKTKLKDEPDLKAIEDLMINMISCKLNYSKRDSFEV